MRAVLCITVTSLFFASCMNSESGEPMETQTMVKYMPGMDFILHRVTSDTNYFMAVGSWPKAKHNDDTYKLKLTPVFFEGELSEGTRIQLFLEQSDIWNFTTDHGHSKIVHDGKLIAIPADIHTEMLPI